MEMDMDHQNSFNKKQAQEEDAVMAPASQSQGADNTTTDNNEETKPGVGLALAALSVSFNIRVRSADMPMAMWERALRHVRSLLHASAGLRPRPTLLARSLKKEFDSEYGPAWHCVAGKSFGSFVTHSPGGFLYFSVNDSLYFLLFKTQVRLLRLPDTTPPPHHHHQHMIINTS